MKPETVLFLCAHNDDQIVGAGGTVAKYTKEGKKVITVIFSFGEMSNPLEQDKITRKTRVIESKRAAKVLGESEIYYLGLKEGKFTREIESKRIHEKIEKLIKRTKPKKIFTHSIDDPHPDHQAIYKFTLELANELDFKGEIYTYNVWNYIFNFRKRDSPKLVVDITDTLNTKVKAFKLHKSQSLARFSHMWGIYLKAMLRGLENHVKYAEVFYKIR